MSKRQEAFIEADRLAAEGVEPIKKSPPLPENQAKNRYAVRIGQYFTPGEEDAKEKRSFEKQRREWFGDDK